MSNIAVTVAICTYRRFDWLTKCLDALSKQTVPQDSFKVLIIDNSLSPDESAAYKQTLSGFTNLEYVITDRCGIAFARTEALRRCTTPILAYTDDDCLVNENWVEEILKAFERHPENVACIGGKIEPNFESDPPEWLQGTLLYSFAIIDWGNEEIPIKHEDHNWLLTANAAYRTEALRRAGGFSEKLGRKRKLPLAQEEFAANQVLRSLGYDLYYSPALRVKHFIPTNRMDEAELCKDAFWDGVSHAIYRRRGLNGDTTDMLAEKLLPALEKRVASFKETREADLLEKKRQEFREFGFESTDKLLKESDAKDPFHMDAWPVFYCVIPCLNAAETIDNAILSVVTQRGDFSIRLHVQDGGSTDGTVAKLKSWQDDLRSSDYPYKKCRNIVFSYASEPDSGMYDAIDKGFSALTPTPHGFMTWLNADDELLQLALQAVYKASQDIEHLAWIGGSRCASLLDGSVYVDTQAFPKQLIQNGVCDGVNWPQLQQEGTFFQSWLYEKAGGLNTSLRLAGDYDLWTKLAQLSEFVQAPWPMAVFVQSENQLSRRDDGNAYQAEVNSLFTEAYRSRTVKNVLAQHEESLVTKRLAFQRDEQTYFVLNYPLRKEETPQEFWGQLPAHMHSMEPGKAGSLSAPNATPGPRSFLDSRILHTFYNRSPRMVRKMLTGLKYKIIMPVINRKREYREKKLIRKSKLFFTSYYLQNNADLAEAKVDPLTHYVRFGDAEGRQPNPMFDPAWYREKYPDVSMAKTNALCHYLSSGSQEGRDPCPFFSTQYYMDRYPDVAESKMNPLLHYLRYGIQEERKACPGMKK